MDNLDCELVKVSEDGMIELWRGNPCFKECIGDMDNLCNRKNEFKGVILPYYIEISKLDNVHTN